MLQRAFNIFNSVNRQLYLQSHVFITCAGMFVGAAL